MTIQSTFVTERKIIKIAVPPESKRIVQAIAEANDMKEQGVAGRVYDWFSRQSPHLQLAIMGLLPDDLAREAIRIELEAMASSDADMQPYPAVIPPKPDQQQGSGERKQKGGRHGKRTQQSSEAKQ